MKRRFSNEEIERKRLNAEDLDKTRNWDNEYGNLSYGICTYDFDEFDEADFGDKVAWLEDMITKRVNGDADNLYRCLLSMCKDLASMAYREPSLWERLFGGRK